MISWCYDGTYGYFIDNPYGFFIDSTYGFSLIHAISGKGDMRAGKGQEGALHPLLALALMIKVLKKEVTRA